MIYQPTDATGSAGSVEDEATALQHAIRAGFPTVKALADAWLERDAMLRDMVDALDGNTKDKKC